MCAPDRQTKPGTIHGTINNLSLVNFHWIDAELPQAEDAPGILSGRLHRRAGPGQANKLPNSQKKNRERES